MNEQEEFKRIMRNYDKTAGPRRKGAAFRFGQALVFATASVTLALILSAAVAAIVAIWRWII